MIDSKSLLGIAVRNARGHTGMSRRELAESLNITPRYLMGIENGQQKPSYDLLCMIVSKLDIQTEVIFRPTLEQRRQEVEKLNIMLHYFTEQELSIISATVHAIMKYK